MCSKGSAQARHRYRSLHAVEPNAAVRSVWTEPHAGHGTPPASPVVSVSGTGPADRLA